MLLTDISPESKVAIYSRKSREDEDIDVLVKHKERLNDFVNKQNLKNVTWYEEVVSGSKLDVRHEFNRLLDAVKSFKYDLIICVDFDRITRGDAYERGVIERAFKSTQTRIFTLDGQLIDFNDDNSLLQVEVKGLLSNYELKQITKRMINGKKDVVKKGVPHSGNPPYGYYWDKNTKTVLINEEEKKNYRMMMEWFVTENLSFGAIAKRLNDRGIKTPTNTMWYGERISKLLQSEFHLGYVVYGELKAEPTGRFNSKGKMIMRMVKNPDPSKIIKEKGVHEPIKTPEEHAKIIKRVLEHKKYGNGNITNPIKAFKLKSLVRCPYCKLGISIVERKDREIQVRKCTKKSKHRTDMCDTTSGIIEPLLYMAIIERLKVYKEELFKESNDIDSASTTVIEVEIESLETAILKHKKNIEKEKEMFKADIIDIQTLKENIDKIEAEMRRLEDELIELKQNQSYLKKSELDDKLEMWKSDDVIDLLSNPFGNKFSDADINRILKSIILYINYYKVSDTELDVRIVYR